MGRLDVQNQKYDGFNLEDLTCYGCVNSLWAEPPPGKPSGNDSCQFCIRNRLWRQWSADAERQGTTPQWADRGNPICVPMDAYRSIDMQGQVSVWIKRASERDSSALEALLDMHARLHPEEP